ncbi:MAG TPA: GNAT family N-acetyltransferase [Sphaerochaeta sp.]|nr:GNAT family N-acetyltransferase [Sphaerochaeta sp.]
MTELKKKENGFYIGEDHNNPLAEITYHLRDERTLVIDHTYVSDTLRGQGVGSLLVRKVAELARKEKRKIVPLCSYAKRVMIQNPDYQDVLIDEDSQE